MTNMAGRGLKKAKKGRKCDVLFEWPPKMNTLTVLSNFAWSVFLVLLEGVSVGRAWNPIPFLSGNLGRTSVEP